MLLPTASPRSPKTPRPARARSRCLFAVLVGALVTLLTPGTAGAEPLFRPLVPPPPQQDAFYSTPAHLDAPRGTVLGSRTVVATALSVPTPARAWQIKYRSEDNHGRASAYIATVLVPLTPWRGAGERPLLSYQPAEDGVGLKCAPSYGLRAGLGLRADLLNPTNNSSLETLLIAQAVGRGWAVVVPDYQGPDSEFTGAAGYAHGVLDGIRAATHFAPAGISASAPIGVMGYSGGSIATAAAIQTQPAYAPELTLAGAALGGTVGDFRATMLRFNAGPAGGAILVFFAGLDRAYPDLHILRYLNQAGRDAVANVQSDCVGQAAAKYPAASLATFGIRPDIADDPDFIRALAEHSPLNYSGTSKAPVLFYHSDFDEFAPIAKMRQLATQYCHDGVQVHQVTSPLGEHGAYALTGAPTAMSYLDARFHGHAAPDDC